MSQKLFLACNVWLESPIFIEPKLASDIGKHVQNLQRKASRELLFLLWVFTSNNREVFELLSYSEKLAFLSDAC